jgi:hypothetical protein
MGWSENSSERAHFTSSRDLYWKHRLEWLALMRHYGAPTRLLDWTYSLYVALFFSLAESNVKKPATVWALDTAWLRNRMKQKQLSQNQSDNLWDVLLNDTHLKETDTWKKYLAGLMHS